MMRASLFLSILFHTLLVKAPNIMQPIASSPSATKLSVTAPSVTASHVTAPVITAHVGAAPIGTGPSGTGPSGTGPSGTGPSETPFNSAERLASFQSAYGAYLATRIPAIQAELAEEERVASCQDNFINCETEELARNSWANSNVTSALQCFREHWETVREEGAQFDTEVARYFGYTLSPNDFQCDVTPLESCEPPAAVDVVCMHYFDPETCHIDGTNERAAGLLIMRSMANLSVRMAQAYDVLIAAVEELHRETDDEDFRNTFLPDLTNEASLREQNAIRSALGGAASLAGAVGATIATAAAAPLTAGLAGVVGAIAPLVIGYFNALQAPEIDQADVGHILESVVTPMRDAWRNAKRDLYTHGSVTDEGGHELSLLDDLIEPAEGSLAILENLNTVDDGMRNPMKRILLASILLQGWRGHLHRFPFVTFANDVGDDPCDGTGLHADWGRFRHPSAGDMDGGDWENISIKMDNRCYYLLGAQLRAGWDENDHLTHPEHGHGAGLAAGWVSNIHLSLPENGDAPEKRQMGRRPPRVNFDNPLANNYPDVTPLHVCAWTRLPGATKSRLHGRNGHHNGLTLESIIRAAVELWHHNGDVNRVGLKGGLSDIINGDLDLPVDIGPAGSIVGIPVCDYIIDERNPGEGCPTVLQRDSRTCGVFTEAQLVDVIIEHPNEGK